MSNDPFAELAEQHATAHYRSRLRAAKTRAQRKMEKRLSERDQLYRDWIKWHKQRKAELLAGDWRAPAQELAEFLEGMTIEDAPALIALTKRGPWRDADKNTKFLVLEMISHSITHLREREGMEPFDDPLPWDNETNGFLIIREMLR